MSADQPLSHEHPAHQLQRMKLTALGLLGAAAVLYVAATALEPRHLAWGYAAAFAEAAMVGAIADWFAVVALFRHPLGLPIPHTAIIPRNKNRIGDNLAHFLSTHFLSTPQLLERIRTMDPARRLADWLVQPPHAEQISRYMVTAAHYGLTQLDQTRLREFMRNSAITALRQVNLAHLTSQVLDALVSDQHHQSLLDELLLHLAHGLQNETLQTELTEAMAREVKGLRYIGLDHIAAKIATRKIITAVAHTIADMAKDPYHSMRQRFDGLMHDLIQRLQTDPALQGKADTIRNTLLTHPTLDNYVQTVWQGLQTWLQDDLSRSDSRTRQYLTHLLHGLGDKLRTDTAMQQWINAQILAAAPGPIERYRQDIEATIIARIHAWDAQAMTHELERHIGRDLQFIRINGTIVGGLVGLVIHAVTQWIRG